MGTFKSLLRGERGTSPLRHLLPLQVFLRSSRGRERTTTPSSRATASDLPVIGNGLNFEINLRRPPPSRPSRRASLFARFAAVGLIKAEFPEARAQNDARRRIKAAPGGSTTAGRCDAAATRRLICALPGERAALMVINHRTTSLRRQRFRWASQYDFSSARGGRVPHEFAADVINKFHAIGCCASHHLSLGARVLASGCVCAWVCVRDLVLQLPSIGAAAVHRSVWPAC